MPSSNQFPLVFGIDSIVLFVKKKKNPSQKWTNNDTVYNYTSTVGKMKMVAQNLIQKFLVIIRKNLQKVYKNLTQKDNDKSFFF